MTGTEGHRIYAAQLVEAEYGVTLETMSFRRGSGVDRFHDKDLDRDGYRNLKEWELTVGEPAPGQGVNEARVAQFVLNAMDPEFPGESPPGGWAKSASNKDGGGGGDEPCPNADCLPTREVTL